MSCLGILRVRMGGFFFGAPLLRGKEQYNNKTKSAFILSGSNNYEAISYKDGLKLNRTLLIAAIAIAAIGFVIGTMAFTNHHTFQLSHQLALNIMVSSAVSLIVLPLLLGIQKGTHDYIEKKFAHSISIYTPI